MDIGRKGARTPRAAARAGGRRLLLAVLALVAVAAAALGAAIPASAYSAAESEGTGEVVMRGFASESGDERGWSTLKFDGVGDHIVYCVNMHHTDDFPNQSFHYWSYIGHVSADDLDGLDPHTVAYNAWAMAKAEAEQPFEYRNGAYNLAESMLTAGFSFDVSTGKYSNEFTDTHGTRHSSSGNAYEPASGVNAVRRADAERVVAIVAEAKAHAGKSGVWDTAGRVWFREPRSAGYQNCLEVFPQGAIDIVKSSADASITDGRDSYSLEGAEYTVYTDSACTKRYATLALDASGKAGLESVPEAVYYVRETKAGKGYRLDSTVYTVDVRGGSTARVGGDAGVTDAPKTGAVSVKKSSSNPSLSGSSSCYSLAGAQYTVYADSACTRAETVLTLDSSGAASAKGLALGRHWVKETRAGKGYALDTASYAVDVKADETVAVNGKDGVKDAPKNDPANMLVAKVDAETGKSSPLGAGTLAGAEFTVRFYEGYYTAGNLPARAARTWVFRTDENGKARFAETYLVSGDALYTNTNGIPTLPLGTVTIQETKAPAGYLLSDSSVHVQQVTETGTVETVRTFVEPDEANPTVAEQVKRGDFRLVKRSEDQELLANVAWRVTSKTTGESHVVVTDANGGIDTSSARGNVNANDAAVSGDGAVDDSKLDASCGVWFAGAAGGEIKVTGKGALPYDTYELQELRCAANEGMKLAKLTLHVTSDGRTVDLGTVTDVAPTIETVASDRELGGHTATPSKSTVIEDTVKLGDLDKGHDYTVKGELVDSETGESLATAEDSFTSTGKTAKRKVEFALDSTALAGRTVTVLERLYEGGDLLASHEDVDDADQQVSFPEIRTRASASGSASGMAEAAAGCKLTDTVSYAGLEAGRRYALETELVDAETGEAVEGGSATTELVPEASSGEATVEVEVDASALAGRSVVFFETLRRDGATVAKHQDKEDRDQTVRFPKVGTTARDGKTGASEGLAEEGATLVDTVAYENVEPGLSYTVSGTLHDTETGEVIKGADGNGVAATATFVPESESGEVEVTFEFDASALAGKSTVAFESLSCDGQVVARHEDKGDKGQTVSYPKIGTEAAGADGSKTLDASDGKVKVVDTVSYENLTPGESYTVSGTLVDKATGEAVQVDGKDVTASAKLEPKKASGEVEVTFEFDASALGGMDAVAFEELSANGKVVARHSDIDDAKQTVYLRPQIQTKASTKDGNELTAGEDAEIVDTVTLKGLQPGRSYTLTATPMDKGTKAAIAISSDALASDGPAEASSETGSGWSWSMSTGTTEDEGALAAFAAIKEHASEVEVSEDGGSLSVTVDGTAYTVSKQKKSWTIEVQPAEGEKESYGLPGAEVKIERADSGASGSGDGSAEQASDLPEGLSAYERLDNGRVRFTPTRPDVEVQVPVSIEGGNVSEGDIVMFESLARDSDGTEIAKHEDLEDADQTVHVNAAPVKTVSDVKKTVEKLAQTGLPAAIALLAAAAVLGLVSIALRKRAKWAERHLDD